MTIQICHDQSFCLEVFMVKGERKVSRNNCDALASHLPPEVTEKKGKAVI